MLLRDMLPESVLNAETGEFLRHIQHEYLMAQFDLLRDYYDKKIPLTYPLSEYGVEISDYRAEEQCECTLSCHGSNDLHKSARYYPYDRNSGDNIARVFCHKCRRVYTAFTYILRQEKDFRGRKFRDTLEYIEKRYNVPFPRDIVLSFDPDEYYSFSFSEKDQKLRMLMGRAEKVSELMSSNPDEFLSQLEELLKVEEVKG